MQELEKILEEIENERTSYEAKHVKSYEKGLRFAADVIRKHMNAGWIPVEERLPEDYSQVMVSMYDLGWITIGTYSSHSKLWKVNSYITGLGVDVRAWRPLPDPYRPVTKP